MFILRNLPDVMFRFRPDGAQGGGDGGDGGQQQGGNQGQQASQQGSQNNGGNSQGQGSSGSQGGDNQGLAKLLARYDNNALAVAEKLLGENFELREKNREHEGRSQGAVILRDADKASWEQYKALGAPSEIANKLRSADLERIAAKAGYDPEVFADLDRMAGGKLQYEAKTETVDGKAVERLYVKDTADANAQPQLLSDFIAAKYAKYLPALQPTGTSQGQGAGGSQTTTGTRFPAQGTGNSGSQGGANMAEQFVKETNDQGKAAANPLLKK